MPHGESVQPFPIMPPSRQEPVHQGDKTLVVGRFQEVSHFVYENVFKTLPGFFGQFRIETNAF